MKKEITSLEIAARIWVGTCAVFGIGWTICFACLDFKDAGLGMFTGFLAACIAAVASLPIKLLLLLILPVIKKSNLGKDKLSVLLLVNLFCCLPYALVFALMYDSNNFIFSLTISIAILFACSLIAVLLSNKAINTYFYNNASTTYQNNQQDSFTQINTKMETTSNQFKPWENNPTPKSQSNKVAIKAIIVAVLTLAMLIPTTIISNMVIERQANNTPKATISADGTKTVQHTIQSMNYEKTMRTTKYAVLVIGLTFAVFFLIETMHKKPVHPVQYTLVGLALAIFYTLLLSIGEYIKFDYAYLLSGSATIILITLYVKSHFQSWKTSSALGAVLTALYGFILVLVSLEDTALIVGSIGLFIVLAIVMYATRKINWYNPSLAKEPNNI